MAYTLASTLDVLAEREARAIDIPGVGKGLNLLHYTRGGSCLLP